MSVNPEHKTLQRKEKWLMGGKTLNAIPGQSSVEEMGGGKECSR